MENFNLANPPNPISFQPRSSKTRWIWLGPRAPVVLTHIIINYPTAIAKQGGWYIYRDIDELNT
jgi:hypothetical protein